MRRAAASPFAATVSSSASWRRLLLLLVRAGPAGGGVSRYWSSGGGWEADGSRFILVVGCLLIFFSNIVGGGTRFLFLRPCGREKICYIPGDAPSVCVGALATDAGLGVCSPVAVMAAGDPSSSSSSSPCATMVDACSATMMRAGVSRRWLMRRFHALELSVVEEGGSILVVAVMLVAGVHVLELQGSWGCCYVISRSSRVFSVKLQRYTVLSY